MSLRNAKPEDGLKDNGAGKRKIRNKPAVQMLPEEDVISCSGHKVDKGIAGRSLGEL